jgi:hypothetical protein
MDALEQENAELRGEVTTLKADLERLNAMVESLVAAQNQPPPPKPPQTTPTTGLVAQILIAPLSAPQYAMPKATLGVCLFLTIWGAFKMFLKFQLRLCRTPLLFPS